MSEQFSVLVISTLIGEWYAVGPVNSQYQLSISGVTGITYQR